MPINAMMSIIELAEMGKQAQRQRQPIDPATIERCVEAIQWLRPMTDPKEWIDYMQETDAAFAEAILACRRLVNGSTAVWTLMPAEPTREIIEALYGPYLSVSAHESRVEAYRAALRAAQVTP